MGQGSVGGGWLPPPTFPVIAFPIPSIGHNEVIGVCRVGPEAADPHGREHWAEMLANPRKPVEHWHQLVEVSGGHLGPARAPRAQAACIWLPRELRASRFPLPILQPVTGSSVEGHCEGLVCRVFRSGQLLLFPTDAKHKI